MKTLTQKINRVFVLFSLLAVGAMSAQAIDAKSSKVVVKGTSPMHDWEMTSTSASFTGTANDNAITNVKFAVAAKSLKSTKGSMMDNKAYNALNADKAPNIIFTAASLPVGKSNVAGKLSIAGKTNNVSIAVNVVKNGNSYTIIASESLKMSDYGMETPGFLGVHTGDVVTVTASVVAN